MRRFSTIILSILLGAVAVAVGMGMFLHLANTDRTRLAGIAIKAQQDSKTALNAREAAVNEANTKLANAENEVQKTQTKLQALQDERDLMVSAQVLTLPTPKELRTWKEIIKLPLGVSVKMPPQNEADLGQNEDQAKSLSLYTMTQYRWFSIVPYDEQAELFALQPFASSSTAVDFLVNGHVIVGKKGQDSMTHAETIVAHIQSNGVKEYLITAHTIPGQISFQTILSTLATLNFSK